MPEKRKTPYKWVLLVLIAILIFVCILFSTKSDHTNTESKPDFITLEEYMKVSDESWFLTGKKEYIVQAMMVSKETSFHNDFEVVDYTVTDDGETVILKGEFEEMWTSKLPKVIITYRKPDGNPLTEEDFVHKDTWIEIAAIPEPNAYYAMHVPSDINVIVETAWGDQLHTNLQNAPHGNGDYLVCRVDENGNPDLSDVWILNGVVFPKYYDMEHKLDEQ